MSEATKPPLTLTVERDAGPFEIKMTYGLEMDLRRMLPDPASVMTLILNDQFTQDYVIRRCLTESKKMLRSIDDLISEELVDISSEDGEAILMWAAEHQLYFFMSRVERFQQLAARPEMKTLLDRSKIGLPDSPSMTPSAGPSESSKETSMNSSGDMPVES